MQQEENVQFKVRVECMTFNHAPFIVDTMKGFTLQQTCFPFVCTIFDDHSTDGEQKIIKKYLNDYFEYDDQSVAREKETDDYSMIFVRHRTNRNCFFAVVFLKYNHYSINKPKLPYIPEYTNAKYCAICEGDDYWCDPEKLQKQVDYLEEHEDCGMVYTSYRLHNEMTNDESIVRTSEGIPHDNNFKWRLLEQKVLIGTCTVLIRRQLQISMSAFKDDFKNFLMGDTQTWFNAARLSNIGYIPDVTGVYRKQYTGATATFDPSRRAKFIRGCLDLHLHLAYKYGAPLSTIQQIKNLFGIPCFTLYIRIGDYEGAKQLNRDFFYNNKSIDFIINIVKNLNVRNVHGLGTLLRTFVKVGAINLD